MNLKKVLLVAVFVCVGALGASARTQPDETYQRLRLMVDIMELIHNHYVEETQPQDLVSGAIAGMVRSLDPFSEHMEERAFREMRSFTQGSYSGVGLRIMTRSEVLTIITPMIGTPAYAAGILPNDIITHIDDTPTRGMTSHEAVSLIRGPPNTRVTLTIAREGEAEPLKFTLTRQNIQIETIHKSLLDDVIYVKITDFNLQSARDLERAITELSRNNAPKGVVLDFRNNPGGVLDAAVDI
ncbi:MAG: PDZ domain-containing protein, partial [Elusimicrobia bacterium]|nr:PDZ domain-containing protein [Elusimicrobiota bacterium]